MLDEILNRLHRMLFEPAPSQAPGQADAGAVEIDQEEFALYGKVLQAGFRALIAKHHPEGRDPDADLVVRLTALQAQFKQRGII